MKKIAFIASIFALLTLFIACNSDSEKKNSEQAANNGKKISVVATIYPQYAWLKEILGNQADSLCCSQGAGGSAARCRFVGFQYLEIFTYLHVY